MAVIAGLEWVRWVTGMRPQPIPVTIVAAAIIAFFFIRIVPRVRERAFRERLGIEGEKAVGEILDNLKVDGYHAIHDIVEDGYNIDHVLIGPTGVYVLETKTRSKRHDHRDVHVTYDGQHVLVDGYAPDRDPLRQVQAEADRVRDILHERTGMSPPIRPVVLFPGWLVDGPLSLPIWVLSGRELPKLVRREPVVLNPGDVHTLATALEDYVRAKERGPR